MYLFLILIYCNEKSSLKTPTQLIKIYILNTSCKHLSLTRLLNQIF